MDPKKKKIEAEDILNRCMGTNGVWAGPTTRRYQCWTRDFSLIILPLLLERKQHDVAKRHLQELNKRQHDIGQIPQVFLDKPWSFTLDELSKIVRKGKVSNTFKQHLLRTLWNMEPDAHDAELHYIIAMHEYDLSVGDHSLLTQNLKQIQHARWYIEQRLLTEGLLTGGDWREWLQQPCAHKPLLSNNALLHHAYVLMHQSQRALFLRQRIEQTFWHGAACRDAPDRTRFDPLGGSLAVLHGAISKERHADMVKNFRAMDSTNGVTVYRNDIAIVVPFVVGFTVLALLKMGQTEFAQEQYAKLLYLKGFRESYDTTTGKGFGVHEDLRSAALFLRATRAIEIERLKHVN